MKIIATVALLQLCLSATVSDNVSTETVQTAEPGVLVRIPCNSTTPASVRWTKDGHDVRPETADGRLAVLQNGSLEIRRMGRDDEGIYLCSSTLPDSDFRARVQLRMASGPKDLSTLVFPVISLSNGTLVANRGAFIHFRCSASSEPSQRLTWTFSGAPSNNTLISTSQTSLEYWIKSIQPGDQGVYTCGAINTVSNQTVNKSSELLVYYLPPTHPDCMWIPTPDLSFIQLNCSWPGMYPTPKLSWGQKDDVQETNNLSVMLNSSLVQNEKIMEKKFTCTAQHALLPARDVRSCSIILKAPYPVGKPMAVALEGSNVTLSCTEVTSVPTANTTWRKGLLQALITPGSKYILSGNTAVFLLTITNTSKDDEDVYFCRSENQFGVVELQVQLSVKSSSSAYVGGVIGVFISFLIVGSAIIIARVLYSRRHQICLGGGLWGDERGDVLSLVESDDEHFFQDTVPQLRTEANGRRTTLVEVHRIPSSDHEETGTAEKKPQQPEETQQTEDLVPI
nr:V-set and immunoglobulin domain-containing protein 10 [Nothobranchius furzeri]